MGLDVVELVMRVEEEFAIQIVDEDAGTTRTVGDLYRIVLKKLNLPYQSSREIERNPPPRVSKYTPWTTPAVLDSPETPDC